MLQEHLVYGVLQFAHLDYLNAHRFVCQVVFALVHCAAVTLADRLINLVGVALDGFYHLKKKSDSGIILTRFTLLVIKLSPLFMH